MSNDSSQIINKAWNYAHVLRDDGLSYMTHIERPNPPVRPRRLAAP